MELGTGLRRNRTSASSPARSPATSAWPTAGLHSSGAAGSDRIDDVERWTRQRRHIEINSTRPRRDQRRPAQRLPGARLQGWSRGARGTGRPADRQRQGGFGVRIEARRPHRGVGAARRRESGHRRLQRNKRAGRELPARPGMRHPASIGRPAPARRPDRWQRCVALRLGSMR